jgi:hypothetical protein
MGEEAAVTTSLPAEGRQGPRTVFPGDGEPRVRPGRRRDPRYETSANLLWIQWWEGEDYLGRSARLVNVSRGGAMIIASALIREGRSVRIFLEEQDDPVGVAATVLGVVEGPEGMHLLRLVFHSPCPDGFMEAAAFGFESWLLRAKSRV